MKRIHIIGRKSSGKTTLVTELVHEFRNRGREVGTIKHTHHRHELDTPGKDSHRHREAGAAVVGILSPALNALFWPPEESDKPTVESRYDSFASMFSGCEFVLVEGDTQTTQCKLEVWRAAVGSRPIAGDDPSVAAIITDDQPPVDIPSWPRADVAALADQILSLLASD